MITEMDQVSGAEVPKKCCENCKHSGYCQGMIMNTEYMFTNWDDKVDFCSRHEFEKESEE